MRMNDLPTLSIVVPAYNVGRYIAALIESVCVQLEPGLELIIVDDGSTDDTVEVVTREMLRQPDATIRLIESEKNEGLGQARRRGLSEASGAFLWFVDGDDLVAQGALSGVFEALRNLEHNKILMFRNYRLVNEIGEFAGRTRSGIDVSELTKDVSSAEYMRLMCLNRSSPNVTNKIFPRAGLRVSDFSERRVWEDNPTMANLLGKFEAVHIVDIDAYEVRERPGSIMRSATQASHDRVALMEEVLSIAETLNLIPPGGSLSKFCRLNSGVLTQLRILVEKHPDTRIAARAAISLGREVSFSALVAALQFRQWKPLLLGIWLKLSPSTCFWLLRARASKA